MNVLAIHDGHDAGACLLRAGRPGDPVKLFCSLEERRLNLKSVAGLPRESIKAVLAAGGVSPGEVSLVALSGLIRNTVPTRGPKPIYKYLNLLSSLARTEWGTRLGRAVLPLVARRKELLAYLAELGLGSVPVKPFDHHACHAATAYYFARWAGPTLVLTLDGAGDGLCATVGVGDNGKMTVVSQTPKFHSPAAGMYSAVTEMLGMRPYEHEYKLMGMAPYGRPDDCLPAFRRAFTVDGLHFRNRTGRMAPGILSYWDRALRRQRFDAVAAGCQQAFEELLVAWVKNAVARTGVRRVAAAGGAFLNVKANKLIRELPEVDDLFVFPAADDGGTAPGAAILGYLSTTDGQADALPDLPRDMYLGLEFSEPDLEAAAKSSGLPYRRMADPARELAGLLAGGNILARFDGREELGPRALGNRSILADPRDLGVIRRLNFAIKQRDFWMPFAASVLEEDRDKYLVAPTARAFYMIEAFDTTAAGRTELVAGIHPFDQTIRPQVVNELNLGYRDLLRAFKERTGVGGLLNTSFNLHGSPIVGTPQVALHTLEESQLDYVALGPFLVGRPGTTVAA